MRPQRAWHPWVMLAPTLASLLVFAVYPVLYAAYRSGFAWDLLTAPHYTGAAEYRALLRHGDLARIFARTLAFSVLVVVLAMSVGLGLALVLDRDSRWFSFVRSAVFSAYVVSWVSVALLWMWLLDPDNGLLARLLAHVGIQHPRFLTHPDTALATLASVTAWKLTGYALVIFSGALRDVPRALLEAAALDGAGPVARFRFVTWPALRPTLVFVATTSLIVSFQVFDVIRIMTQGGPAGATTLFVYAIYEQVFLDLRVGRASALSVVFFVTLLGLSALQLWAWNGRGREGVRR